MEVSNVYMVQRNDVKWYHHVADFANILKGFIGTNYLSLAYGFKMSGLALGIGVGILVCLVTNHCCQLIVQCKNHLIDDLCYKFMYRRHRKEDNITDHELEEYKENLTRNMTYTDIGRLAYGKWGARVVDLCVLITQTGFCIQYAIFIGTMLDEFILSSRRIKSDNITRPLLSSESNLDFQSWDLGLAISNNDTTSIPPLNETTTQPFVQEANYLPLLVFSPVILFVPMTFFRNVRSMGIISVLANLSVFIGFWSVLIYISIDFEVNPTFEWVNLATLPVYIGSVTAAYEAIGVIIPIESSMEGNQHNFDKCLLGAITFFTAMVGTLGSVGYLTYGADVKQIIAQNLPADEPVVMVINITLIIGVILTYPLMIFPVVEIMESFLFKAGGIFGPPSLAQQSYESPSVKSSDFINLSHEKSRSVEYEADEDDPLLSSGRSRSASGSRSRSRSLTHSGFHVAATVPKSVATWKRNLFRGVLALVIVLLAVALRNVFAYVGALVGALGSSPLSFILPCLFHMKIRGQHLNSLSKVKDVILIVMGIVIGILGCVITIKEMIKFI